MFLKLPSVGINPQNITFTALTMESHRTICVRDQTMLSIVDVSNPTALTRLPLNVDSAIMNPEQKILALRGKLTVAPFFIVKPEISCKSST